MTNPPSPDDEIVAKLNTNELAGWRMLLILMSAAFALVVIYAAAYFTGEVALLQSEGVQMAIAGLFVLALVYAFAGFAGRLRPVAPSDANDPRIVRRRIDAHHRHWRWILVGWLPMTLGLLPTVTTAGRIFGVLGHAHPFLAIAAAAAMIAPAVLFSFLTIAGPGWDNRKLRAILNDEFVRQLRARTARFGYITMMLAVSVNILVTVWRPDLALQALWWSLYAGSTIPALYYVIADWRAGREN